MTQILHEYTDWSEAEDGLDIPPRITQYATLAQAKQRIDFCMHKDPFVKCLVLAEMDDKGNIIQSKIFTPPSINDLY